MEPAAYMTHGPVAKDEAQFLRWAEQHLLSIKTDMPEDAAHELVTREYQEFIENEGVEFGDPDFYWTQNAAHTIVDEILYPTELHMKRQLDNS